MEKNNIVVYRHVRLDTNEVFYIGIGKDKRPYDKHKRSTFWNKIINKTEYRVDILFDELSWEQAVEKEKEFIQLYGRRDLGFGTLVNMTDGGEGMLGNKHSDERKLKISTANKGKKRSEQSKLKMSQTRKGKTHSEETKLKISHIVKGRKLSEEAKLKISQAQIGNTNGLGNKLSDEHKEKISDFKSKPIKQLTLDGILVKEWKSASKAAESGEFTQSGINKVLLGLRKKHRNFIWIYNN